MNKLKGPIKKFLSRLQTYPKIYKASQSEHNKETDDGYQQHGPKDNINVERSAINDHFNHNL